MVDLGRQYLYAKKLVGDLNRDLVHHCLLRLYEKGISLEGVKHPDTYFYRCMIQEVSSRGSFAKTYARTVEMQPDSEPDHSELDPHKVKRILVQMQKEGYGVEVEIFRMVLNGRTIQDIAKGSGVCRNTIPNCINFVKDTVRERYGDICD